jgi:amphi-Trp domain-containing protein
MPDETIFEFEQTFDRTDVAAYLREIADNLDDDGELQLTAGGSSTSVSVPERLQFEVEVERDPGDDGATEMELEFELTWHEREDGTASGSLEIE